VVNLDRNAEVVHLLATRPLADTELDVLAQVGPVVIQADELGHGAVGTAMAHNSVVAHLKLLELVVVGGSHDVECGDQLTRFGGGGLVPVKKGLARRGWDRVETMRQQWYSVSISQSGWCNRTLGVRCTTERLWNWSFQS
jgi:hypothetical protein